MSKLNDAILEAYEEYHAALDYVQGWKQEATNRKSVVMALINAARKSNPELAVISSKEMFARTAEMWEASHPEDLPTEDPADTEQEQEQADEVEQAPADEPQELNSVDA